MGLVASLKSLTKKCAAKMELNGNAIRTGNAYWIFLPDVFCCQPVSVGAVEDLVDDGELPSPDLASSVELVFGLEDQVHGQLLVITMIDEIKIF